MERYSFIDYGSYFEILVQKSNDKKKSSIDDGQTSKKEKERIAISRARQKVREYCFCNHWDFFVTLTINSLYCNRYALEECQKKAKEIFKKIKRKYNNFKYIFITEQHKDGAFHFHGLISGIPFDKIYINENYYLYLEEFNELGFNSLLCFDNSARFINYIIKYIEKNPIRNSAGFLYMNSRGLKVAQRFELSPINIDNFPHFWCNDYIKKVSFYKNELSRQNEIDLTLARKIYKSNFKITLENLFH